MATADQYGATAAAMAAALAAKEAPNEAEFALAAAAYCIAAELVRLREAVEAATRCAMCGRSTGICDLHREER